MVEVLAGGGKGKSKWGRVPTRRCGDSAIKWDNQKIKSRIVFSTHLYFRPVPRVALVRPMSGILVTLCDTRTPKPLASTAAH